MIEILHFTNDVYLETEKIARQEGKSTVTRAFGLILSDSHVNLAAFPNLSIVARKTSKTTITIQ